MNFYPLYGLLLYCVDYFFCVNIVWIIGYVPLCGLSREAFSAIVHHQALIIRSVHCLGRSVKTQPFLKKLPNLNGVRTNKQTSD
jgi:hypothetical protein